MRIANLIDSEDIRSQLREAAADTNRLRAAWCHVLPALVEHLEAQGPEPTAFGRLEAFGRLGQETLVLSPVSPSNEVSVMVWADWMDYGPSQDGLPIIHYRIQIRRSARSLTRDERVASVTDAKRVIYQAFGW